MRRMWRAIALLLATGLIGAHASPVGAQESMDRGGATTLDELEDGPVQDGGPTLSLEDALRIARSNNPNYRQFVNNREAAGWGVTNAYASFLPSFNISGSLGYRGPGEQTFLTTTFRQQSATISSNYSATLNWNFSGQTLMQPGLERAERDAADADVANAAHTLERDVTLQYIAVLQARENVALQEVQVERNQENLRTAQARFDVGQVTRMDVQQARVAKGQSDVELLRLEQLHRVELLRLFQTMGVVPPDDVTSVTLTEEFELIEPSWTLDELLGFAEQRNPELVALRKREDAAAWRVRSTKSQYPYLPRASLTAGWSGFTQEFTNIDPLIQSTVQSEQASAEAQIAECQQENEIRSRLQNPLPPQDCSQFAFSDAAQQQLVSQIRDRNNVFPFDFTQQPFQASLFVSLPIFNNFDRERQVAEAGVARRNAELTVRNRALQIRTEVAQRFYDVQRVHQSIAIQEENRVAGRDQLQLAQERYRLGAGTFFDLLDAQVIAQQAERDYINAVYDYHRAVAQLEAAVGRDLR